MANQCKFCDKPDVKPMTAREIIEEACQDICDNLCKYSGTLDEDTGECVYIGAGNVCPLFKLY